MIINYKKVEKPYSDRRRYSDLKLVGKRYEEWFNNNSLHFYKMSPAEKDNIHFMTKECGDFMNILYPPIGFLDVGCGNGIYSKLLSDKKSFPYKIRYEGFEVDKQIVKICKNNFPHSHFFKAFADSIDKPDNKYDIVFCSGTIQYTLDKWKESLLEMKRVTKKYIFILRLPITKFTSSFFVDQSINVDNNIERHNFIVFNRIEFENYLEEIGLDIVKRDYSSEEYVIEGVKEKIILNQYLLEKLM